jgi:hypothetical protein
MAALIVLAACQTSTPRSFRVVDDMALSQTERRLAEEIVAAIIARYERGATPDRFLVHYIRGEPDTVYVSRFPAELLATPNVYGGVREPGGEVIVFEEPQHPCPPFC